MKQLCINLFVFCVAFLMIFALVEGGFRIYASKTGAIFAKNDIDFQKKALYARLHDESNPLRFYYGEQPNYDHDPNLGLVPRANYRYDFPFTFRNGTHQVLALLQTDIINAQHMRRLRNVSSEKGKPRIAMFGDSFTYGIDVPTPFAFPNLVEEMLPNTEVLNYGFPGVGTDYMYAVYKTKAVQYDPDIVILNIFANDVLRNGCGQGTFYLPEVVLIEGKPTIKNKHIPTYEEFLETYVPPRWESYFIIALIYQLTDCSTDEELVHGLTILGPILEEISKEKKLFVTLFLATPDVDPDHKTNKKAFDALKLLLEEKQVPHLDATALFNSKSAGENMTAFFFDKTYFFENQDGGHFNTAGHAVFAEGIKKKLLSLKWITPGLAFNEIEVSPSAEVLLHGGDTVTKKILGYVVIDAVPY